jgi:hypothetical protein
MPHAKAGYRIVPDDAAGAYCVVRDLPDCLPRIVYECMSMAAAFAALRECNAARAAPSNADLVAAVTS